MGEHSGAEVDAIAKNNVKFPGSGYIYRYICSYDSLGAEKVKVPIIMKSLFILHSPPRSDHY